MTFLPGETLGTPTQAIIGTKTFVDQTELKPIRPRGEPSARIGGGVIPPRDRPGPATKAVWRGAAATSSCTVWLSSRHLKGGMGEHRGRRKEEGGVGEGGGERHHPHKRHTHGRMELRVGFNKQRTFL